jgi:hypothetical protein
MNKNKRGNFGYASKTVDVEEEIEVDATIEEVEVDTEVEEDIINELPVETKENNYSINSNEVKKIKGKITLISPNYIIIIDELGNGIRVDGKFDYKYGEIVEI